MTHRLQKIGNSRVLIFTRTMLDHLVIAETVEVTLEEGKIVLTAPKGTTQRRKQTFEEAAESTFAQYDDAVRRLADVGK